MMGFVRGFGCSEQVLGDGLLDEMLDLRAKTQSAGKMMLQLVLLSYYFYCTSRKFPAIS